MNRIYLIFSKDTRHFWKEIVISWVLLAVYVWEEAQKWSAVHDLDYIGGGYLLRLSAQFSGFLLVLSWCLLLVRLVQDDQLVGDRQFWVTRPYRWPELLASKIAFVLLFINVPLLLAQMSMLKLAGFAALPHLKGLTYLGSGTFVFLGVVLVAASITATLVQFVLLAFIFLLYITASSAVVAAVPNSSMPHAESILDAIGGIATVGVAVAIVLMQYARRRTMLSRGVLAGVAVLLIVFDAITPYAKLIAKAYPRNTQSAVQIVLDTRKPENSPFAQRFAHRAAPAKPPKKMSVTIPLLASALNPEEIVFIDGNRATIDLPNGQHWQSNWQRQAAVVWVPETGAYASFEVPRNIFESVKSTALTVNIEFAFSTYRKGAEQWDLIVANGNFPAPRLGLCSIYESPTTLHCRAPLHGASSMLATVNSSESTCGTQNQANISHTGYFWSTASPSQPMLGIDPVIEERIYFTPLDQRREQWISAPLMCPGTPIHFRSLEFVGKSSTLVPMSNIRLSEYGVTREAAAGVGVMLRPL